MRRVPVSVFCLYRVSLQRKKCCQQVIGLNDELFSHRGGAVELNGYIGGVDHRLMQRNDDLMQDGSLGRRPQSRVRELFEVGPVTYLGRHWRGELSLLVSVFVNGLLLNIVATSAVAATAKQVWYSTTVAVFLYAFLIVFKVWQLVGISRAAVRYRWLPGWITFARLVQVLVVIYWITFFLILTVLATDALK